MAAEKKYLAITPRIKAQAKAMWSSGEFKSIKDLANRLAVSPGSLKFLAAGAKGEDSLTTELEVKKALATAAAEDAVLLQARSKETKEEHYKMATGISKLTWAEILNAKTTATPFALIAGNLKALEIAMTVLKKAREERFAVLGLNDDNVTDDGTLPELLISELTPEQIVSLRESQEEEDFLAEAPPEIDDPTEGVVDTTEEDEGIEELE